MQAVLEVWKALYLPVFTGPRLIAVMARLLMVFQCS